MTKRFYFLLLALIIAAVLAFTGRDVWALATVLVGFLALGRVAILPFSYFVGLLLCSAVSMLMVYWPFWYFGDVPFAEFIADAWYAYFVWVAAGIGFYWYEKRASEETWEIIRDNHSAPSKFVHEIGDADLERGYLTYQDEALPVDTLVVSTGLFLARPGGEALHIPWEGILELSVRDDRAHTQAFVGLSRTLIVGVPWRAAFEAQVPDSLKQPV